MKKIILLSLLILASVLRLYKLSTYPAGLNADEAALGYNAYSLITTRKDEHGHPWPINLESFGDFKPAGYAYLLIPFVKVLGLTEFAVRFPSAIFGTLAVLFIYLLVKEILSTEYLALTAAFMLAINPWHLHFSRGGWESNVATTLLLIGIWSFVKWLKNKKMFFLALSALHFALSMYVYQSTRLIAPLLGLGLVLVYYRDFLRKPKQTLSALILLLILLVPITYSLITSDASSRFSGVGLLADEGPLNRVKELRGHYPNPNSFVSKLLHNRPVIYALQFISNYTDHFGGNFLFINGDVIERNQVPETGLFYLTDFIFLALGIVYFVRNHNPYLKIIWLWVLVAPIAAALTFQTPHALRSHNLVIPMNIIISAGIYWSLKHLKFIGICVLVIVYSWQLVRYLHQYYVHYPQTYPAAWEYGFKELVSYVQSNQNRYDKVWITDKYDQPYILFLFYLKYPAQQFQGHHQLTFRDKFNFSTVRDFGKYHFESAPWEKVRDVHSTLIVAAPEDIPAVGVNIVKTIYFPSGQPAFKIISN